VFTAIPDLAKQLSALDHQYACEDYPLPLRPAEAFQAIYGSVADSEGRAGLFADVTNWFLQKYGQKIAWDGFLGETPLIIRGELHFGRIMFVEGGSVVRNIRDSIATLDEQTASNLTPDELSGIAQQLTLANMAFNNLYTLRCDKAWLPNNSLEFIKRGYFDIDGVVPALRRSDTQTSIFLCHQAAEKFLKAAYIARGGSKSPESFSHRAVKVFTALIGIDRRFSMLEKAIMTLETSAQGPEIKYQTIPRTLEQAHSNWYSTLIICGFIAEVLTCDHERGTSDSALRAGKYYRNRTGLFYLCESADSEKAALISFEIDGMRGTPPVRMELRQRESATYLEITDHQQLAHISSCLRKQFGTNGTWVTVQSNQTLPEWGSLPFMNIRRVL
jgi:HEPN domain-containing protein